MAARPRRRPDPGFTLGTAAAAPAPAFGDFRLDEMTARCQCRFPCGTVDGEHRFCGRPTEAGPSNPHGSWCEAHRAVVFEAWRPGGRVLARAGRR